MTTALAASPSATPDPPAEPLPQYIRHYPALPQSVRAARHDVAAQLQRWGLDGLIDTATLVTSELITNAHAATHDARGPQGDDDTASRIGMRLTYSHRDLIVEVWDHGSGRPIRPTADTDTEDGRGLRLVAALARDLGYYPVRVRTPDGYRTKGKIVWAALPHETPSIPHLPNSPAENLPRRDPQPPTHEGAPNPDVYDRALLQRVLDALRNLDDWTPATTPTSSVHRPTGPE
ncbi:ATP-binding protein [Protofrankia symbiont of Coriaria ruscifolia]|uniref:ATP-binding protein n=1 Tax=Protofrankia symbiont of Coriaria ruscifolia TaxID=1306542 RepID=UPI001041483D|nr:ATP-binding protein [Protofrankia symbiont of Coriaria ruscifolia]